MRTCEHMTLGQLRMGARQAKNAPLTVIVSYALYLCKLFVPNFHMCMSRCEVLN